MVAFTTTVFMPLHGRWVLNQSPVALGITVPSESIWYNRGDGSDVFHRNPITPAIGAPVYVYEVVAVPPGVVTVTVTAPTEPAGAVILIVVAVLVLIVAAVLPNVTDVASARFVPVMLTKVPAAKGPEPGEMTVIVGVTGAALTFTHVIPDIPEPPLFVAVKFTDQFPATNACVALLVVLNSSHVANVRLFLPHFHDVGVLVDVSLNTMVNGARPAQLCVVLFVTTETLALAKDATGTAASDMVKTYAFPTLELASFAPMFAV